MCLTLERVRLGYVTEMNWPRRPGKTPYMDQATLEVTLEELEDGNAGWNWDL